MSMGDCGDSDCAGRDAGGIVHEYRLGCLVFLAGLMGASGSFTAEMVLVAHQCLVRIGLPAFLLGLSLMMYALKDATMAQSSVVLWGGTALALPVASLFDFPYSLLVTVPQASFWP